MRIELGRKGSIWCMLGAVCFLCLAGCGKKEDWEEPETPTGRPLEEALTVSTFGDPGTVSASGLSGTAPQQENGGGGSREEEKAFDSSRFAGNIESIRYAGGERLLVYGDSLFLYDVEQDKILGEYSDVGQRLNIWNFCVLPGGYALFGETAVRQNTDSERPFQMTEGSEEKGLCCWFFDEKLELRECLDLHQLLLKEGEVTEFSARLSQDGKWMVIAGIKGLYLYHVTEHVLDKVLTADAQSGEVKNVSVTEAYFTGADGIQTGRTAGEAFAPTGLIFTGIGIPEGKSDSVPIYGTMKLDGSDLQCYMVSDYALSSQMIAYETEIWFPENFQEATGRLLVTDGEGRRIRMVELEGEDTGKDGVTGSDGGTYVATLAIPDPLGEWQGWRLRIYEAACGKLVWEQNVGTETDAYSGISCSVRILDERRECIVTCGRGQNTVTTSFFF